MKSKLITLLCAAVLSLTACSTFHKSDSHALQGTWEGQAAGDTSGNKAYMVLSGKDFDFHDASRTVWYKGTFSIREDTVPKQFIANIKGSSLVQYVGKTSMAIYQLADGNLTIAGFEPGIPEAPKTFDAPGAVCLMLQKH
jgi:uncharacterized protein (TIGR03067 family)